jgi:small subunit ribosomal protein S1
MPVMDEQQVPSDVDAPAEATPEPGLVEATPDAGLAEAAADAALADAAPDAAPAAAEDGLPAETPPVTAAALAPVAPAAKRVPTEAELEARRARAVESWERIVAARESGQTLSGFVIATVKGGLLVDLGNGIRGFLPASQARVPEGGTLESLLKTRLPLKVLDLEAPRRRAVVSHRRVLDEQRRAKRQELVASLAPGQRLEAVVVRLVDFGAFVDLGGVDGLIPMSELALERVDKSSDVLSVGERLAVDVLRVEDNGKKISLSRKSTLADPWRDHASLLRVGTVVEGKVVAKEPRLQVEIAPGIVGSVRESDANPADYEIGETVEVTVRVADRRTRRVALSTSYAATPTAMPSSGFAPLGVELRRNLAPNGNGKN